MVEKRGGREDDGQGPVRENHSKVLKKEWSKTHVVTISLFLALLGPCRFQDRKGTKQQPTRLMFISVHYAHPKNARISPPYAGSYPRWIIRKTYRQVHRPESDHVRLSYPRGDVPCAHISRKRGRSTIGDEPAFTRKISEMTLSLHK